jgi:hypothetical protein
MKLKITLLASLCFCLGIDIADCTNKKNANAKSDKREKIEGKKRLQEIANELNTLTTQLTTGKGPKKEIIKKIIELQSDKRTLFF